MDAVPSAVILFVRRPASDARSRTLVLDAVSRGVAVTSAVILFVRRPASDARSRTLVLDAVSRGAAITSAVILFVRRPASDARSRGVLPGGAPVMRVSGRRGSKSPRVV